MIKGMNGQLSIILGQLFGHAACFKASVPYIAAISYVMLSAAILMTCTTRASFSPDPRTPELREDCLKMHSDYGTYIIYVVQLCTTIASVPYIAAISYIMLSAAILMTCTTRASFSPDPRTPELREDCLKMHSDYGTYIIYVVQLCTTIGYGDMRSCTTAGKITSLLVSIAGLPIVVYIIMDAGDRIEKFCRYSYCRYKKRAKRQTQEGSKYQESSFGENMRLAYADQTLVGEANKPDNNGIDNHISINAVNSGDVSIHLFNAGLLATENYFAVSESEISREGPREKYEPWNEDDICDLPLWIGPSLLALCISVCSMYYYFGEGYGFGSAVYYSMLTFLTGSFHSFTFPDVLPIYFIIFIGFSMLSLTINTILGNIKNATTKIKAEVKRQIDSASLDESGNLDIPPVDELLQAVLNNYSSATLVVFLPKSGMKELKIFCANSAESKQEFLRMKQRLESQLAEAVSELEVCNTSNTDRSDLLQTVGTSGQTAKTSTKTSTSDLSQTMDALIQTVQADRISIQCQCTANIADNSTQSETRTGGASVLAKPEIAHGCSQTAAELCSQPEVAEKAVTASPRVRHIAMQHPSAAQLFRRASEAIIRRSKL